MTLDEYVEKLDDYLSSSQYPIEITKHDGKFVEFLVENCKSYESAEVQFKNALINFNQDAKLAKGAVCVPVDFKRVEKLDVYYTMSCTLSFTTSKVQDTEEVSFDIHWTVDRKDGNHQNYISHIKAECLRDCLQGFAYYMLKQGVNSNECEIKEIRSSKKKYEYTGTLAHILARENLED